MEALADVKVLVSEKVPLPQATLNGLLEAIRQAFQGEFRVVGLLYRRGEDLVVERQVPATSTKDQPTFKGPYECIRQYAQIRLFEDGTLSPTDRLCRAAMILHDKKMPVTGIVTRSPVRLANWLGGVKAEQVLRVPIFEDPDAPDNRVFICGALNGPAISDVEYAVVCRME